MDYGLRFNVRGLRFFLLTAYGLRVSVLSLHRHARLARLACLAYNVRY